MADITVRAAYASVVEDDGQIFVGFAQGEGDDEPYVLFRQPVGGGTVWFEVNDESLGAEDAVDTVQRTAAGLAIRIRPQAVAKLGWARSVDVRIGPRCEDADDALAALRDMLGGTYREPPPA